MKIATATGPEMNELMEKKVSGEALEMVAGGVGGEPIGPEDEHVEDALRYIRDAYLIVPRMMYYSKELTEILGKTVISLTVPAEFNIAKAIIFLKSAWTTIQVMPQPFVPDWDDEERKSIVCGDVQTALNILEMLV